MYEDNWANVKKFYTNYSNVNCLESGDFDQSMLAETIQNELENFVKLREKKKQEEIEHKRMAEIMLKQKKEEEEKAKIAKKLAAEQAALEAAAQADQAAKETESEKRNISLLI